MYLLRRYKPALETLSPVTTPMTLRKLVLRRKHVWKVISTMNIIIYYYYYIHKYYSCSTSSAEPQADALDQIALSQCCLLTIQQLHHGHVPFPFVTTVA
jgi:hypothetical protein